MLNLQSFGTNLYGQRRGKNITQEQLADLTNISVQSLSGYENGSKKPTLDNAIRIANALNTSLDFLCDGSDVRGQKCRSTKLETLADIQAIFDALCENLDFCEMHLHEDENQYDEDENYIGDDIDLTIKDCPKLVKYYKNYKLMSEMYKAGDLPQDIFADWKSSAQRKLDNVSVKNHDDWLPDDL